MTNRFLIPQENGDFKSFDTSCTEALQILHEKLDFGLWMVTRVDGADWIVLKSHDRDYGVRDGDVFVWMESFCCRMVKGLGPTFAPESDNVLAYAQAEIGRQIPIQAYMGFPLLRENGELIGTLCAIDPSPVPESWSEHKLFVEGIATELAQSYNREYSSTLKLGTEQLSNPMSDDEVQVLLSPDWNSSMEFHEQEAKSSGKPVSIMVIKLDQSSHPGLGLESSLSKLVGRGNFVSYQGGGKYAALLLDCNAPRLDAYAELVRTWLDSQKFHFRIGYAVTSGTHGIRHAFELALSRVDSPGTGKIAA